MLRTSNSNLFPSLTANRQEQSSRKVAVKPKTINRLAQRSKILGTSILLTHRLRIAALILEHPMINIWIGTFENPTMMLINEIAGVLDVLMYAIFQKIPRFASSHHNTTL